MMLWYNRGIQTQTSAGAFITHARSNQCKDELQMANLSIPRTSGIYKITCTANGKIYVGSSVDLHKRWGEHKKALRNKYHHNKHLQRAWNKYGESVFIFEVLEYVTVSELRDREQYQMDSLKAYDRSIGFNIALDTIAPTRGRKMGARSAEAIAKTVAGVTGQKRTPEQCNRNREVHLGIRHTQEQKEKISLALRGKSKNPEAIAKTAAFHKGRKRSPETVERIRIAKTGVKYSDEMKAKVSVANKGKVLSEETRAKISASHMGIKPSPEKKSKRIISLGNRYKVVSPSGDIFEVYNLNQFCKDNKLSQSRMSAVSCGLQDNHRGWKVRRIE